jgi:hypothetical protein
MATRPLRKIFIVRLWADTDGQWAWQGEVQHAETGELQRIHSAGELLDYLQQTMAPQPEKPPNDRLH